MCADLGMLCYGMSTITNSKFEIDLPDKDFTPRGILSTNHAIIDTPGFLSPIILQGHWAAVCAV